MMNQFDQSASLVLDVNINSATAVSQAGKIGLWFQRCHLQTEARDVSLTMNVRELSPASLRLHPIRALSSAGGCQVQGGRVQFEAAV